MVDTRERFDNSDGYCKPGNRIKYNMYSNVGGEKVRSCGRRALTFLEFPATFVPKLTMTLVAYGFVS